MRVLLYFQLVLGLVGTALAFAFVSSQAAGSFAGGAGMTLFNLVVLVFGWPRILAGKQVAMGIAAIVIKFAILGWILYLVAHSPAIHLGWFALGLATVMPSVIAAAFATGADSAGDSSAEGA